MPWNETTPMDQKVQFVSDYLRNRLSMSELCLRYGVSRKTGYKWIDRYLRHGPEDLTERSRRPSSSPNATAAEGVQALLEQRQRHPSWGGKKLLTVVGRRHPDWALPHRPTVCEILRLER